MKKNKKKTDNTRAARLARQAAFRNAAALRMGFPSWSTLGRELTAIYTRPGIPPTENEVTGHIAAILERAAAHIHEHDKFSKSPASDAVEIAKKYPKVRK